VTLFEELTEANSEVLEAMSGKSSNPGITEKESIADSLYLSSDQDALTKSFLSIGDVVTSLFKGSTLICRALYSISDRPISQVTRAAMATQAS
jgi:hypothetical protein